MPASGQAAPLAAPGLTLVPIGAPSSGDTNLVNRQHTYATSRFSLALSPAWVGQKVAPTWIRTTRLPAGVIRRIARTMRRSARRRLLTLNNVWLMTYWLLRWTKLDSANRRV